MHDPVNDGKLMAHEADGIKELDNNLPRWWVWLFYGAIIFAFPYMWIFHISGSGDSAQVRFEKRVYAAHVAARDRASASASGADIYAEPATNDMVLAKGQGIFLANCAACHTETGGGQVGPNLCDDYFIHGPAYADTVRTVLNGVPEKGMISWKKQLRPDDIQAVCSYVHSLRGSNPPNPKPPQGKQHTL